MNLYFIGIGLAAIGSGIGIGIAVKGALEAMARQPSIQPQLQTSMIIGVAFIEALTIYALIATFLAGG